MSSHQSISTTTMIQIRAEHPSLLNLPTELFDSILDHLSDQNPSLRSCCLVSRAFLPTAQALLFRQVVLYVFPEIGHLRAGTKLRHLVESSHLLSHTQEFLINGGGTVNERLGIDTELLPALEDFINLKRSHITADCGRSLQYISFAQITWDLLSPNLPNATFQRLLALESVTHIIISWSDIPSNVFEHLPSEIKILELVHVTIRNPAAQVPDGYPKLINLPAICPESLIIRGRWDLARIIFNNPSRRCDGTSIRALHLSGLNTHEIGTYVTFAPYVEKLALEIKAAQEHTPLNFSQFSRLQYLYMGMHRTSHIAIDREIRWLAQSLGHLETGNSFRSITLTYAPDKIYDILAWAELDSVLVGSPFESKIFSGVTINVVAKLSTTDFGSFLPRTIEKNLLKVLKVRNLFGRH